MGAIWQKNQPTASLRRCDLLPASLADGTPAPRGTDFTGYVFITRDGNDYYLSAGTIVNKRRKLAAASDTVESVDTGADTLTLTAHAYETGDGPFISNEALGAIGIGAEFWIIDAGDNLIQVATTLANAYAGTEVALTGTEAGAIITVNSPDTTARGVDGDFRFTAPQAETNYDTAEISVAILGHATYWAYTTVDMATEAASVLALILEGSITVGDALRIVLRTHQGNFSDSGDIRTFRDMADTKDSHHGTITTSGRSAAGFLGVDDPT